jgi:hypothetical protein
MPERSYGDQVGFNPHVPPNHIAHLDRDDANALIDYVLRVARPVSFPLATTISALFWLAIATAALVVTGFSLEQNHDDAVVRIAALMFAAGSGAMIARAAVKFRAARAGTANNRVTEIVAVYEHDAIERGGWL